MRAASWGFGKKQLFVHDVPKPQPKANEVLVKVQRFGFNPIDLKLTKQWSPFSHRGVGIDFSGVVEQVGSDFSSTNPLQIGDTVMGNVNMCALAEYVAVNGDNVAKKPDNISIEQACGTGVPLVTAYCGAYAITKGQREALKSTDSVLVFGGSSAVGNIFVQIAKHIGCKEIVAVCSKKRFETVLASGATECVDYTDKANGEDGNLKVYAEKLRASAKRFDVIFDAVTSPDPRDSNYHQNFQDLATNYVAINGSAMQWARMFANRQAENYELYIPTHNEDVWFNCAELLRTGAVQIAIDSVHEFTNEGVNNAMAVVASRKASGKVVVKIAD